MHFFCSMIIKDVINYIENWAPKGVAWEKDNVGLQIGDLNRQVNKILISLDLTLDVAKQAIKSKTELIITHHPFFFYPIKQINFTSDSKSQIIKLLIQNDIAVFSAHTNLDFTKDGVSFQLAKKIGLKNIRFLKNIENTLFKIIVFVPEEDKEKVANSIFEVGGGIIGEYQKCSFQNNGIGTFEGSEFSNPKIGKKQNFETIDEVRLEIRAEKWKLDKIIEVIKKSHPYEQPAFDIYPLLNSNENYGIGAIGELENPLEKDEFFQQITKKLNLKNFRYSTGKNHKIKKVAVCGGSCSSEVNVAINQNADAFITADINYHTFQETEEKIWFIDAGHFETEVPILDEISKRLRNNAKLQNENLEIVKYKGSTNPISFYKYKE